MSRYIYIAVMCAALLSSCARNPVTGKKEFSLMSESQEIALGKESDPSIVSQYGVYENALMQAFINEKGKAMAAISHRPNLPYEFKILDSPVVNAFAVPGGYVYFTRGIMGHFNNEAEFAGVLGHEIGHITARHSANQYSRQMITQILFIGGMVVSEQFRRFGDAAQQGIGLLFLKFSRDHETESDKLGVNYSTKIGYDAKEMAGFFNTLKRLSGGNSSMPSFLSTHPDPGDRFNNVNKLATEAQLNLDKSTLKINRNNYLKLIDGLIYGEDPKQGYVENNNFYHPELKFTFPIPSGWNALNSPAQLQMAPADGKALMTLGVAAGTNLQDAKNSIVTENKFVVIESSDINVNGLPAIAMLADLPSEPAQNGQAAQELRILTYLIQYNNMIYKFYGLSTKADFNNYFSTFQNTMKNFKVLTDSAKLNKKATVIKIITANKTAPLRQLLIENNMTEAQLIELAILNGMELTDIVDSGTMFKVLRMATS